MGCWTILLALTKDPDTFISKSRLCFLFLLMSLLYTFLIWRNELELNLAKDTDFLQTGLEEILHTGAGVT